MAPAVRQITDNMRRELDRLDQMEHAADWVNAWIEGDAIGTDEAAFIAGCSTQTIRRIASSAERTGNPIGRQVSKSVWLISRRRLLNWIERHDSFPARVAAQARAEKWKNGRAAPKIDAAESTATL